MANAHGVGVALLMFVATSAHAVWNTSAGLQVTETLSDNIALVAPGNERHDLVTDVSPNVHLNTAGGRLGLNLDASWHGLKYANGTSGDHSDTQLNSTATLEAIDKWLYVDGVASITQQNVSPFGAQSTDLATINSNRTTVRNYSLTPRVQGVIGTELVYNLSALNSQTSSDALSSSRTRQYNGGLKWGTPSRLFNFGASFSEAFTAYTNQADTTTRSARGTVYLNADEHLTFSAFAGRERNNYSLTGQSAVMSGAAMHWTVSERTSLDVSRESHSYGPTDLVSFSHRMSRSALQVSYSRSASVTSTGGNLNTFSPYYQLFYQILCPPGSTTPAAQCASGVLAYLQQYNLPALSLLPFVSNTTYIQRTLQGSWVLSGARNTVSLTASRSDNRNDSATVSSADILASSSLILQRMFMLNWSLKATPYSNLTASLSRSRSSSPGVAPNDTILTSSMLVWSTRFTPKLMGSMSLRHVVNTVPVGTTAPYRENAAIATLGYTY